MAKIKYNAPIWKELDTEDDPSIEFGVSQGTSGYDSMWSFSGISEEDLSLIELNCDDLDLQDMDTDGDYVITSDEFDIWLTNRGGW